MLKIEKFVTPSPEQWEITIEGARNAMNSWDQMDSEMLYTDPYNGEPPYGYSIGPKDMDLLMRLSKAGTDESKYRRMLPVHVTLTAPLFWWKEFDTYKVGTVRNSCSTMHKIHFHPFNIDMYSHEGCDEVPEARAHLESTVKTLEYLRQMFNKTHEKKYWRAIIEILPDGFMMKATVMFNYEVLASMRRARRHHKLDEWHVFCDWIEELPYSELIVGE